MDNSFYANNGRALTHEEVENLLAAYTADELEPSEQIAVEQHLVKCDQCQQALTEVWQIRNLLRTLSLTHSQQAGLLFQNNRADSIAQEPQGRSSEKIHRERSNSMHSNVSNVSQGRGVRRNFSLIAAALVVTILVGSMAIVLNLTHKSTNHTGTSGSGGGICSTPTPIPTPIPTATVLPSPTPSPTPTPSPIAPSPTPTPLPTNKISVVPTPTPAPVITPTVTAGTCTPTPGPTAVPSPTPTPIPTANPSPSPTPTPTPTPPPTPTPTP